MKKFLSLILALTLCAGLAATAFAAGETVVVEKSDGTMDLIIPNAEVKGVAKFAGWRDVKIYEVPVGTTVTLDQKGSGYWGVDLNLYQTELANGACSYGAFQKSVRADDAPGSITLDTAGTYLLEPCIEGSSKEEMISVVIVSGGAAPVQPEQPAAPQFSDVAATSPYAAAIDWAVEQNITKGTTDTTFSPTNPCSKAQILTFLYRAVGSPEPTIANPFSDIAESSYYYKAAIWAYEKGMVSGSAFNSSTPCTRSQTVKYLWQFAGSPKVSGAADFADVSADADYAEAVAWALENNVTQGTTATTFAPDKVCNRGQIVTFLYRSLVE